MIVEAAFPPQAVGDVMKIHRGPCGD